jgi:tRNA 2-selenouridine synthase
MGGADLPVTAEYRALLLNDTPLLDVRAPVEFTQGAFPNAVNLPLLNDSERQRIGICYKQAGQQAAIALGQRLVSGESRATRINAWRQFAAAHPEAVLYCFRGGLRSRISQQWLAEVGVSVPRVAGGYRALRRFLLDTLERLPQQPLPLVLAGRTGVAKTRLIRELPFAVDLEGLARHRGSAFGRELRPQPAPIDFENTLAIRLLKLSSIGYPRWVVEDEGQNIGALALPLPLRQALASASLVVLEASFAERVDEVLNGYVREMTTAFAQHYPPAQVRGALTAHLLGALTRIRKRLGGWRYQQIAEQLHRALQQQFERGCLDAHRDWIARLLADYYDPMYDYQLQHKRQRIVFQGDWAAVRSWLWQCGVV